jgi:glycosyltransferase involved in cell wall biosynthesis
MNKIIWLTEWFPVDFEPYNGDSIERHAQAASLFNSIYIIYIKKDTRLPFGKIKKEERIYNDNCKAVIYYYPSIQGFSKWLDRLLSTCYFFSLHYKAIRVYKKQYDRPDGIQVNVSMRNGIIALWYKFFSGIRYVILERWGIFLPEAKPYWKEQGFLFRFFAKKVFRNASAVITVSRHLGEMIKKDFGIKEYKVVPNVVNPVSFSFRSKEPAHTHTRFIHVSNLDYAKNIEGMLTGFKVFLEKGYAGELLIHAPASTTLNAQITSLGLAAHVKMKGEDNQLSLAASMRKADALILFSRYETFGIVAIEANACGTPVITSNYPTFNETIENYKNGIIAEGTDAAALLSAMIEFVNHRSSFNSKEIAATAAGKYSYLRIGKLFDDIYKANFNG